VTERATFDLREILRAFSVVAHRVLPTTIEWHLELPEDDVQVVVDRAQLEQVLLGLVLNSRDAMPRGGQIEVSLSSQLLDRGDGARTPMACIRIRDSGEGIAADVLPNLWTPFFTTKPMGTGLGLSVGQAILREHGGDLRLESPAGVSATFAAYIPLAPRVPNRRRESDPKIIPLRAEPTGITVLLVEDERAVRSTTQRILERAGYRVAATGDGEEAWRLLEEHPDAYDVVVTDLIMPRLSGAELVRRIRARQPDFPIVVTSAHPSRDWDAREIRAESVAVLKKPFAAATLVETLRTMVGRAAG
jgi:CheY-like chemotaxis protein